MISAGALPTLEEILERREQRAARQRALLDASALPLVSVTLVVPGPSKEIPATAPLLEAALAALRGALAERHWPLREVEVHRGRTGGEALLVVDAEPRALKRLTVELEEHHPLGRLWDLDVLSLSGTPLSRSEQGLPPRTCLLCDRPAPLCARSRAHPLEELLRAIDARVEAWQADRVASWATRALLDEVTLTPKPGLVDAENSGAHTDMTLETMRASISAIAPWLSRFFLEGVRARGEAGATVLNRLRPLGLACEAAMFAATEGINTHKGSIFSFGLLCGCAGRLATPAGLPSREQLCAEVARLASPLLELELHRHEGPPRTAGERLFREHGLTGARGEAATGYATVREHALPSYLRVLSATGDETLALFEALLELMAHNRDTNLAADGGLEGIRFAQERARSLLEAGGACSHDLIPRLREFDRAMIARNLSPGGSADLLAVTGFLARLDA